MATLYLGFGNPATLAHPFMKVTEVEGIKVHTQAELTSEQINLVEVTWYGDGSVYLQVEGYDEPAVKRVWERFRLQIEDLKVGS